MGAQLQCFGQYPTTFSLARCAKAGALLVVVAAPGLKKSETCAKGVLARALIVSSFVVILCFSAFHSIRPHRARQDAALKRHPERVLQSRGQHAHQKVSIETSPYPHLPSHGCCSSILEVDVGACYSSSLHPRSRGVGAASACAALVRQNTCAQGLGGDAVLGHHVKAHDCHPRIGSRSTVRSCF